MVRVLQVQGQIQERMVRVPQILTQLVQVPQVLVLQVLALKQELMVRAQMVQLLQVRVQNQELTVREQTEQEQAEQVPEAGIKELLQSHGIAITTYWGLSCCSEACN